MKRWIKISAITLAASAVVVGGAFATALQLGERKMHRRIAVDPAPVAAATEASEHRARALPVHVARLQRVPRRDRHRQGRRQR
jgi:hypothetical protein